MGVSVYWTFLILELRSSISWNIRNFFRGRFLLFFRAWTEYCGASFWENTRNFLILELESFISRNVRNFFRGRSFYCGGLGLKTMPGSPKVHYSQMGFKTSMDQIINSLDETNLIYSSRFRSTDFLYQEINVLKFIFRTCVKCYH